MTPEATVILLTRNAGELFHRVLTSLFACQGIDDVEVLVIDSGSSDGTEEAAARHGGIRLERIPPREFGHGRTRNLGARMARGDQLIYLVQDAVPVGRDFLTNLRAPLEDPEVAACFARQLPSQSANPLERFYQEATYPSQRRRRSRPEPGPVSIDSVFFSNVASAITKTVWERFPFDPDLIMSEDQKWAKEVLLAGFDIVYEPKAEVLHSHHYRLAEVFRRNFDSGYSLVGITEDSLFGMARYELDHLRGGARSLLAQRQARWIPYLLIREVVRALGFACGRRGSLLPLRWRRALSQHKTYWDSARRTE